MPPGWWQRRHALPSAHPVDCCTHRPACKHRASWEPATGPAHKPFPLPAPQVDPASIAKNDTVPMLEVQLELVASEPAWAPELLKSSAGTGVRDMVESWLRGMLEAGALIRRLDTGEGERAPGLRSSVRRGVAHGHGRGRAAKGNAGWKQNVF